MKIFLILFLLIGCGAEEPASTVVPVKAMTTNSVGSEYLADVASLPVCDDSTEGRLIYTKAEKQFNACLAGKWEIVDVRGKDGAKGVAGENGKDGVNGSDGKDGVNGVDGIAGVNGTNGVDGVNGIDGTNNAPTLGTFWTDPDTRRVWVIVAKNVQRSGASCTPGFALPTFVDVLPEKFKNFFIEFRSTLPNGAKYWTSSLNGGTEVIDVETGVVSVETNASAQHVYICHG